MLICYKGGYSLILLLLIKKLVWFGDIWGGITAVGEAIALIIAISFGFQRPLAPIIIITLFLPAAVCLFLFVEERRIQGSAKPPFKNMLTSSIIFFLVAVAGEATVILASEEPLKWNYIITHWLFVPFLLTVWVAFLPLFWTWKIREKYIEFLLDYHKEWEKKHAKKIETLMHIPMTLTTDQQKILDYFKLNPGETRVACRRALSVSRTDYQIQKDIDQLIEWNCLEQNQQTKTWTVRR